MPRNVSQVQSRNCSVCPTCEGTEGSPSVKSTEAEFSLPPIHRQNENTESVVKTDESWTEPIEDLRLPSLSAKKNFTTMLEHDLEVPEAFENPQEALKVALRNMKQNDWQSSTPALINIMQISRFQPELLDSNMPLINRSLCSLLKNTRPQIVRTACQVAGELYKTVQYTQRPEFDELAGALLLKSTHSRKGIQEDARRALDAMVLHLPLTVCVRVLAGEHGASHKNPLIRSTVSSLLWGIVNVIGVDCLFSNNNLKDARRKIFRVCAKFLTDGNLETRGNARKIFKLSMEHSDFDARFDQDVDRATADNIKRHLVSLKYN